MEIIVTLQLPNFDQALLRAHEKFKEATDDWVERPYRYSLTLISIRASFGGMDDPEYHYTFKATED